MAQRLPGGAGINFEKIVHFTSPYLPPSTGDAEEAELSPITTLEDEELKDPGREVLVMTVDLGKGLKDRLVVREHDRAQDLAAAFCQKHGLNDRLRHALVTNIEANLKQMQEEELTPGESEDMESLQGTQTQSMPRPFAYRHMMNRPRSIGDRLYRQGMQQKVGQRLRVLKKHLEDQDVYRIPKKASTHASDKERPRKPASDSEDENMDDFITDKVAYAAALLLVTETD